MKKILIVDDDEAFCRCIQDGLEQTGKYKVIVTTNPEEGVSAARHHKPDLIFLDIMMPKMSGFDVLKALKKDSPTVSIPVVMLTSLDIEKAKLKTMRSYSAEYIVKPVSREDLEAVIEKNLPGEATQKAEAGIQRSPGRDGQPNNGIKVLVVDDEKATCELIETFLVSAGFRVRTCQDTGSVLALIKKEKFDVVMLDLVMPGVDGMEILSEIKAQVSKTKVIVLTGVNDPEVIRDVINLKADDIIIKPFSLNQLRVTLSKHANVSAERG